jgi:hypothetical protein
MGCSNLTPFEISPYNNIVGMESTSVYSFYSSTFLAEISQIQCFEFERTAMTKTGTHYLDLLLQVFMLYIMY